MEVSGKAVTLHRFSGKHTRNSSLKKLIDMLAILTGCPLFVVNASRGASGSTREQGVKTPVKFHDKRPITREPGRPDKALRI